MGTAESTMSESAKRFHRDRAGEIFQSDLTEEDLPAPSVREEADHDLHGDPGVDSQEGDEFTRVYARRVERAGAAPASPAASHS